MLATAEQASVPIRNAEKAQLSRKLYVLVMLCSGPALDKSHKAGVNEGVEAWRNFTLE